MKRWFWAHRNGVLYTWYALGTSLVFVPEIILILHRRPIPFWWLMAPYILWVTAGALTFIFLSHRRTLRALNALNQDCDPEPLLAWTEEELAYWGKHPRLRQNALAIYRMDQAAALSALGHTSQALEIQQSLDPKGMTPLSRVFYYTNLASFYVDLEQLPQAEEALTQAQLLLRLDPPSRKQAAQLRDCHLHSQLELSLLRGETQGVEEPLLALLERTQGEYAKLCQLHTLARLLLLEGRLPEAREHLEYIVAHGNKLHVRLQAQELLDARFSS